MKKWVAILLGLIIVAGVFFGVCFTSGQILYDDEIDRALRMQMQENGLAVLNALKDEEYDVVLSYFDPEADREQVSVALPAARAEMGDLIGSAEFQNFHDHHVTSFGASDQSSVVMSAHALSDEPGSYFVYHNAGTDNVYVSLFTSEVNQREILYTVIWGEREDGWKIHALDIGSFGWSGKRGPDWLGEVRDVRAKSGDIAAYLTLEAVSRLFRPSRMFAWKELDEQAKTLYGELAKSIAPTFSEPIAVQELDSKPIIYGLDAMTVGEFPGRVIPAIHYVSRYDGSQRELVEQEANEMAPLMGRYLEGIDDLGEHLLFVAFEEPPIDPKKQYKTYRTIVKIK